ncbi:MAG: phosphotransferase [Candidatus Woesearchaeota archaeon]
MELSREALDGIWSSYGRGAIISFEKARMGVANHNWMITTSEGRFVLRCVNTDKSECDLTAEFDFIRTLEQAGFPYEMPTPLTAGDGSRIIEHEGRRCWSYPYLQGSTITSPVTRSQAQQMGVMIAQMHAIIVSSDLKERIGNPTFSIDHVIAHARELLDERADETRTSYYARTLPVFLDIIERTPYPQLNTYPIHRDINPENVLFEGDTLTAVIDFDNVSVCDEPLVKDLSNALLYSCTHDRRAFDFERCADIVRSYRSIRNLSRAEIQAVPDLIVLGCLEDFAYEYWLAIHEPERTAPHKLEKRFAMGRWVFEHRDELIRAIM